MSGIGVYLPWDSQPQEVADIAPQWLNGLLAGFNAGAGFFDLAAQKHYTLAGGIGLEPGSGGMGAIGNASSKYGYVDIPEASVDGATIFAVLSGPAATDDRALSAATSANNNNYFAIGTGTSGNTSKMRVLNVVDGTSGTTSHTSADVFDGRVHAVALRWVRTVGTTGFVDGVLDTFAANTANDPLPINRVTLCALGRTSFGTHWAGSIYLAAVFGRALSDAELVYLTGNPWQLFAPRSIPVPVSAGGGTTDATITAAAGVATASTLAATATAASAITQASGVATASTVAASSTAASTLTTATGAAAASTLAASSIAAASFTAAAGVATTSTLSSAATTDAAITAANGAATASTLGATSTAAAAFTPAAGVATTSTMASGSSTIVAASMTPAAGAATASTFAASAVAASVCIAAAGAAAEQTMVGSAVARAAITAAAGVATCSTLVDANAIVGASAWWRYDVPVNDMRYAVPVHNLRYDVDTENLT